MNEPSRVVIPIAAMQPIHNRVPNPAHYPRPITEIHQIEPTSHCNLRCKYCPQFPKLPREKLDMPWEIFEASSDLVRFYVKQGTQGEVSLTGIGEPLMHPRIIEMSAIMREILGPDRPLVIATNGIKLDEPMAIELAKSDVVVYVSAHRPEKAGPAAVIAGKHGILAGVNHAFVERSFNWAGQVNWHVSAQRSQCEYLRAGWGVILADGRITTCCLDADGAGVVGTVKDDPSTLALKPYKHCASCHMTIPEVL